MNKWEKLKKGDLIKIGGALAQVLDAGIKTDAHNVICDGAVQLSKYCARIKFENGAYHTIYDMADDIVIIHSP
jgi:hypothetical protein